MENKRGGYGRKVKREEHRKYWRFALRRNLDRTSAGLPMQIHTIQQQKGYYLGGRKLMESGKEQGEKCVKYNDAFEKILKKPMTLYFKK